MNNPWAELLSALLGQLPLLAAYVLGLVICAMRWNRYPRPAQLAFLGTSFLLIAAIGQPVVSVTILRQLPVAKAGEMLSMLGLVSGVVRMTGYCFLLGAVFFGRAAHAGAGFPMATAVTPPLRSSPSDRTLL